MLEESRGEYISGEDIAKRLYCTRGAVWKAIKSLRDEGVRIDAVTNRGYCLEGSSDIVSESGIRRYLGNEHEIFVLKTVGSTNAYLRELAQKGAAEGTLVVSSEQTRGQGRRGRTFFSPADTGLYLSVLLRPEAAVNEAVKITSIAAVAVCAVLEKVCGVQPEIKWVNDIFVNGKKAAGILTEAAFDMENGIVLTTGNLNDVPGPKRNGTQSGDCNGWVGDTELFNYIQGLGIDPGLTGYHNATILEFDFIPTTNHISFNFISY